MNHIDQASELTLHNAYSRRITSSLVSSTGAAAMGIGAAAIMPFIPFAAAVVFLLAGIVIHGVGMALGHRADVSAKIAPPRWHQPLLVVC